MPSVLTLEELETFKTLVKHYYEAWSPGQNLFDISKAEHFYSKGAELTAYDVFSTPGVIKGWENYKTELTRIMGGFAEFRILFDPENMQVFQQGEITWTTSDFKIRAILNNGQFVESTGRNSLIWERQNNGNWLIVHEHSSSPVGN